MPHRRFEDHAEDADRNRADDQAPADGLLTIGRVELPTRDARDERFDDGDPFVAVEYEQRDRRAQMQHDDECQKRRIGTIDVVPAEHGRN
jgi:hypothetical protein